MNVFVTGASGYIGRQLTRHLLNSGYQVHAFMRALPDQPLPAHPALSLHVGDLSSIEQLAEAMRGCQMVFHLAAFAKPWAKDLTTYHRVNVEGTRNVMQAALNAGVQKVIHSSSCGVFGRSNGRPVDEDHVSDIPLLTEYDESKRKAEEIALEFVDRGLNVVIVSPTKVYGPGIWSESNAVSQLIRAYVQGDWHLLPGDGGAVACFAYVEDVVKGIALAAVNGRSGERYILGGENLSFRDFFKVLAEVSGKNYWLFPVPVKAMLWFGWKEEIGARFFNQQPLITRKWIRKYNYHLACSSDKAMRELGYGITPFHEGLKHTLQWLEEEQNIFFV